MSSGQFSQQADYLMVLRALHRLHELTLVGKDQGPEADAIRDGIDHPWNRLSETEKKRLEGLSEDLYSLSDPEVPAGTQKGIAEPDLRKYIEAHKSKDWDFALALLRKMSNHLPPTLVAFLRGIIWQDAGDLETSAIFVRYVREVGRDHRELVVDWLEAQILNIVDSSRVTVP